MHVTHVQPLLMNNMDNQLQFVELCEGGWDWADLVGL